MEPCEPWTRIENLETHGHPYKTKFYMYAQTRTHLHIHLKGWFVAYEYLKNSCRLSKVWAFHSNFQFLLPHGPSSSRSSQKISQEASMILICIAFRPSYLQLDGYLNCVDHSSTPQVPSQWGLHYDEGPQSSAQDVWRSPSFAFLYRIVCFEEC
jgi:hypothetical protein